MSRTHGCVSLAATLVLLVSGGIWSPAAIGQTWDLVSDATSPANPNGAWSHGWARNFDTGWSMTLMDVNEYTDGGTVMRWETAASIDGSGYSESPFQLQTTSDPSMPYEFFELNKFYCHGGDGSYIHPSFNVIRWTAPDAGQYRVSGSLFGVDALSMPAGVDCQVLVNGVSVFDHGFSYHDSAMPFDFTFGLAAGSTVDLALGPGTSAGAQWTQVSLTISQVSGGMVTGAVKAADLPGKPGLASATIRTGDGSFSTRSNQQGGYSLFLAPGTYTLEASKLGYIAAQTQVTVADQQTTTASFELASSPAAPPEINEIQSANSVTVADEDGDHPDWIEIVNVGGWPVDLLGYGLSDDPAAPFKWTFPAYNLQPGQYLLVFASDKDRRTGPYFHTNYAIKSGGETISLTAPDGTLVSRIPATSIPQDMSYGRQPDGQSSMYVFAQPTPGAPNTTQGYTGVLTTPPIFSRARGFYTSAFNLTLTNTVPDSVLHYTTDGSEPTETSPTCTAPISIAATSSGAPKVTVVRARVMKTGYLPSPVATNSYFVGPSSSAYYNLPIVSLATTRANFFDPEFGIYVYGNHGNYDQNGDAWERPVHVEFFEPGGACGFHCDAGARINGAASAALAQKSLRLYADHQGGPGSFDYQIFAESPFTDYKRIVLRNGGNENPLDPVYGQRYTLIRDGAMCQLVGGLDVDCQRYRPSLLFFNGEYWGVFGMLDRQDKYWIAGRHPEVDPDNIDLLEQRVNYTVSEGDGVEWEALRTYFYNNDLLVPANYEYVKTKMDVSEILIHDITCIYAGNTDWPGNNIRFWRPRTPDGRWRWALFDQDFSLGLHTASSFDALGFATARGAPIWTNEDNMIIYLASLLRSRESRDEFITRTADMLNTVFAPATVTATIDSLQTALSPNMPAHFAKWGAGNMTTWNNNVQSMRDFANTRPSYMRSRYAKFFRLSGTYSLGLASSVANAGSITLNTIKIPGSSLPWQGTYFNDVPIKLTAVPATGHRFVRWSSARLSTQNPATVVLSGDTTVTAVFEVNQ